MLVFHQQVSHIDGEPQGQLALTAEERSRSRYRYDPPGLPPLLVQLPRGTRLIPNEYLVADSGEVLQILAVRESLMEVTSVHPLTLLRAAYHLGNRHVPLEVTEHYLRFIADPVLVSLVESLGATVTTLEASFFPEAGAFHSH